MKSGRLPVLDGVRGIAIAMVLLFHCFSIGSHALGNRLLTGALDGLWCGVDLFFVLSGYLITGILVREKQDPSNYFRNFYVRRSLRIFPAYYFVLMLVFTVFPLLSTSLGTSQLQQDAPYLLLYLQNLVMSLRGEQMQWAGANHFWSLAIEEQFYLFWPFLVMAVPRRYLPWLCALVFALAAESKLWFLGLDRPVWTAYTFPLSRADALVAGAFVAVMPKTDSPLAARFYHLLLAGALAVMALVVLRKGGFALSGAVVTFSTPAMAIIFAGFVKAIHQNRLPVRAVSALTQGWLAWLGRYSYGIYLLHWPIFICAMEWCMGRFPDHFSQEFFIAMLGAGGVSIGVSLVLAWVMYHTIEAPCLRLAERFRQARDPAAAGVAAAISARPIGATTFL